MAAEFIRGHGSELDAELNTHQNVHPYDTSGAQPGRSISRIINASLPLREPESIWDLAIDNGLITAISSSATTSEELGTNGKTVDCCTALVTPSLCHPHIHLDKAFLLSHPAFSDLQIQKGDFVEAMKLTGMAKSKFQHVDLIERGQRVIEESVAAGVTHMRAFVEIDAGVGNKCLTAGLELKHSTELTGTCVVQICAFAQLPLFSSTSEDNDGSIIRGLMEQAVQESGVDVIGSTPYVEANRDKMRENIEYMIDLSMENTMHLDFHLDYNLDESTEPMIWHVLQVLREKHWPKDRTVVLGHCTRLTLFSEAEWQRLREEIGDLPISFVGLPTSDLFMMRTENGARGTLNVPQLINEHGLNACIGMNNIGNAFTPHGSCDPVMLACNGIGIYQTGTTTDAELLYECISTRAREAIGMGRSENRETSSRTSSRSDLEICVGDKADLLIYGNEKIGWRTRREVSEAVYLYDHCFRRQGLLGGVSTR